MSYFSLEYTNEIVSLDDINIQKELDRLTYEKYLRDESIDLNYSKKRKERVDKKVNNHWFICVLEYISKKDEKCDK